MAASQRAVQAWRARSWAANHSTSAQRVSVERWSVPAASMVARPCETDAKGCSE